MSRVVLLALATFPDACPWPIEQVLAADFCLAACSSEDDVKRRLKHFYQGVSEGKIEPGVDTEAHRYLEIPGFAERYPVESLRFNYQPTPRAQAKATRDQWLGEYEAGHPGQKPPLTA